MLNNTQNVVKYTIKHWIFATKDIFLVQVQDGPESISLRWGAFFYAKNLKLFVALSKYSFFIVFYSFFICFYIFFIVFYILDMLQLVYVKDIMCLFKCYNSKNYFI